MRALLLVATFLFVLPATPSKTMEFLDSEQVASLQSSAPVVQTEAQKFRSIVDTLRRLHRPGERYTSEQAAAYVTIIDELKSGRLKWVDLGIGPDELRAIALGGEIT